MSRRGDTEFLIDINEAIRRIQLYTRDTDYENFLEDFEIQDAVIRNLEIIGEAAKNISVELKEKHPQILWKDLAGIKRQAYSSLFWR